MVSCYSGDHIAEDHIDTDIIICKSEESQQKCRLGTVSNRYLRGGGLKHVILGPKLALLFRYSSAFPKNYHTFNRSKLLQAKHN